MLLHETLGFSWPKSVDEAECTTLNLSPISLLIPFIFGESTSTNRDGTPHAHAALDTAVSILS